MENLHNLVDYQDCQKYHDLQDRRSSRWLPISHRSHYILSILVNDTPIIIHSYSYTMYICFHGAVMYLSTYDRVVIKLTLARVERRYWSYSSSLEGSVSVVTEIFPNSFFLSLMLPVVLSAFQIRTNILHYQWKSNRNRSATHRHANKPLSKIW